MPPGGTPAVGGVSDTVDGISAAPSTRTVAMRDCTPSVAISVTDAFCATAVTGTGAETDPAGMTTLLTVRSPLPDTITIVVGVADAPVSRTSSGTGNVGAL